jgi:hypothetical protein
LFFFILKIKQDVGFNFYHSNPFRAFSLASLAEGSGTGAEWASQLGTKSRTGKQATEWAKYHRSRLLFYSS